MLRVVPEPVIVTNRTPGALLFLSYSQIQNGAAGQDEVDGEHRLLHPPGRFTRDQLTHTNTWKGEISHLFPSSGCSDDLLDMEVLL